MGKVGRQPFKTIVVRSGPGASCSWYTVTCVARWKYEFFSEKQYLVSFIDDYSRCSAVYFMKTKDEVLEKVLEFKIVLTNISGEKIGRPT